MLFRLRHRPVSGFLRCALVSRMPCAIVSPPSRNRTCGFPTSGSSVSLTMIWIGYTDSGKSSVWVTDIVVDIDRNAPICSSSSGYGGSST